MSSTKQPTRNRSAVGGKMPARQRTLSGYVSGDYGLLPEHENIKLLSPTSVSMKNSFIIKTSTAQKFDLLYKKMLVRKKTLNT